MPISTGFNHVATLTTDMDRTVRFYEEAFGAVVTFTMERQGDHPKMTIVDLGAGAALNIFEVPADEIIGERRRQGGRGAIDHFALAVPDKATLEQMRERLSAAGADEVGEIQQLGAEWSLFFRDPDGMELEVCSHGGAAPVDPRSDDASSGGAAPVDPRSDDASSGGAAPVDPRSDDASSGGAAPVDPRSDDASSGGAAPVDPRSDDA